MSSSGDPREVVVATILALERACLDADAALVERRWHDVTEALAVQRRLTAELGELFARTPQLSPAQDERVAKRLRGVLAFRDEQLRRLHALRDEIGRRLETIGRARAFSRSVGHPRTSAAFYDTQR
ncbi:MAG TPA: hypothetical protein VE591_01525 [Candidatus Acidoferrum sp.]|nr:hypothetical protein [Candidatus Acidoferrum sp.]